METPVNGNSLSQAGRFSVPGSAYIGKSLTRLFTPATRRKNVATPMSRRVRASPSVHRGLEGFMTEEQPFKELLRKQWNVYSLSPLYNFKYGHEMFKRYARSLDMAFTQALGSHTESKEAEMKSSVDVFPGLNFNPDDHEAVRIQVMHKDQSTGKEAVVLRAFLLCVDMEKSPIPPSSSSSFSYFPVLIVCGGKARATVLVDWLERHFDCRTSPMTFCDSDLQWMLALGCSQMIGSKKMDVLLQYDLSSVCDGINVINCNLELDYCHSLWSSLNANSLSGDFIAEREVKKFFAGIQQQLESMMHIYVTKLHLQEVGSPMAFVSSKGKFKMFFNDGVYLTLHLICDIARERFMQFYQS